MAKFSKENSLNVDHEGHICEEYYRFRDGRCRNTFTRSEKQREELRLKSRKADDKACKYYWDRAKHELIQKEWEKAEEERRAELWAVYSEKEPIKLPIVFDGFGYIPECPICGEVPYGAEQCDFCGQRFLRDREIEEYEKPQTVEIECFKCGAKVTANKSRYNGHISYSCKSSGIRVMQ